jgi:hypothetical protein
MDTLGIIFGVENPSRSVPFASISHNTIPPLSELELTLICNCIERNTNIAKLQIQYGYLQPIAFLNLVSNRMPEKCGFEEIKRANL